MLNCKETSRLVSQAEDRPLSAAERLSMWLHLSVCTACRNFERQTALLRAAMRRYRD